jgi:CBS-domain-containing membrane protein
VTADMTEKQVEDLFSRYDVRALPVVDDNNDVIGLVTYKEVAAAKQRLWNKEQNRLRQEAKNGDDRRDKTADADMVADRRKEGSALKGWMKQHVKLIEASMAMAEAEAVLLENDGTSPRVLLPFRAVHFILTNLFLRRPLFSLQSAAFQSLPMARNS